MKEATKTICFVVAAVAMLTAAIASNFANRPRLATDFETVGQSFYPEFTQTDVARSLVVTSFDPLTVTRQTFEIKQEDGLWQIPSHEGYPAEAAERLGKTSASLMGLTRDSLVGRRTSDHEKFGVIDPRDEDIVNVEAVGQSITLRDANDDVLVDLIIGKQATDDGARTTPGQLMQQQEQTYYYVRRQDESNVYRIALQIDLSTKFADWIEPDLLQISRDKVVAVDLDNYQIKETASGVFGQTVTLQKEAGDKISLTRKSSTDDWSMEGLKSSTEELNAEKVGAIVGVLDEMAIADVKRKPTYEGRILIDEDLNYNLTPEQAKMATSVRTQEDLNRLSMEQQQEFQQLQEGIATATRDLQSKGFNLGSIGGKLELVSAGGVVKAATSDGLLYTLHVGKANADQKKEIEVAGAAEKVENADGTPEGTTGDENAVADPVDLADAQTTEAGDAEESDTEAESSENRYVLIRVAFDESYLGEELVKPTEPLAPVKPEGYTPPEKDDDKSDTPPASGQTGDAGDDDTSDDSADESDAAPAPKGADRDEKFVAYDKALAEYEEAKIDYEVAASEYERKQEERAEQVKLSKRKVEILKQRFENWYYVVSGENLSTLQADRKTLVVPQEPPAAPPGGIGGIPNTSFPKIELGNGGAVDGGDGVDGDRVGDVTKPETNQSPPSVAAPPPSEPTTESTTDEAPATEQRPVEKLDSDPDSKEAPAQPASMKEAAAETAVAKPDTTAKPEEAADEGAE